jgi:hypothetical protein
MSEPAKYGRIVERGGQNWLEVAPTREGPWTLYMDASNVEVSCYITAEPTPDPQPARLGGTAH